MDLSSFLRDVPDFPKPGIVFKDISPLLADPRALRASIEGLAEKMAAARVERVVGIESRGFIFGAALAYKLKAGVIPIRKKGKLPYKTISATYQLEYGTDTLEMHEDAVRKGTRVLIVDDLLATGGTAKATAELLKRGGAKIVGLAFLIELTFLKGRENLKREDVFSLIKY